MIRDKREKAIIRNSTAEFLIFTGQTGEQNIEARYEDETIWLSQKLMGELFAVTVPTINEHLKNIYETGEVSQGATRILREFAIKGYVLDRKRMENGAFLGEDYFERLLEEIREIRLSERKFYQKITDIYASSVDYNKDAPTTKVFLPKSRINYILPSTATLLPN